MCGIAGIFNSKEMANYENINKMLISIMHRGPDDISAHISNESVFGSVRLAIFKLDHGQQPYVSKDKKTVVCFNGEIFNYFDLIEELKRFKKDIVIKSEIELIYHLFIEFGYNFIKKINGQFAISIKSNNKLILFRDPFGIRPIFYHKIKNEIIFCSEIKGILSVKKNIGLNYKNLNQIIKYWAVIGENTIFEKINQVEAGSYIIFENGDIQKFKYYEEDYNAEKNKYSSFEEAKEDFNYNLLSAVKRQTHGDVEVGAYLSGGIDSTAISYCLNSLKDDSKTFSINFENREYDETYFQNIAKNKLNLNNLSVTIGKNDIAEVFQDVIYHTETPLFRTAPSPLFLLSKLVKNNSIKVILTGEGADEILYGYDIFKESKIRNFIKRDISSKKRWELLKRLYAYLPQFQNPRYFNMIKEFYKNSIDSESNLYSFLPRIKNNIGIYSFFNKDFIESNENDFSDIFSCLNNSHEQLDELQKIEDYEIKTLLTNYLLSSQGDRMTMANSIEGRYPFLDLEFVKYARKISNNYKLNILKDKYILRQNYKNKIPKELYDRPKVAYQAPEIKSFFNKKHTKDYVLDYFNMNSLTNVGIFNINNINKILKKIVNSDINERMGFRENSGMVIILSLQILINEFKSRIDNLNYEKKTRLIY